MMSQRRRRWWWKSSEVARKFGVGIESELRRDRQAESRAGGKQHVKMLFQAGLTCSYILLTASLLNGILSNQLGLYLSNHFKVR